MVFYGFDVILHSKSDAFHPQMRVFDIHTTNLNLNCTAKTVSIIKLFYRIFLPASPLVNVSLAYLVVICILIPSLLFSAQVDQV